MVDNVIRRHNRGGPIPSLNAYYAADVTEFLRASPEEIITALQSDLVGINGTVFLEFVVPRIGSRPRCCADLRGPVVFAIEFKVGESNYRRTDINQVWDYALDLKNFHKGSHEAPIVPILVATDTTRRGVVGQAIQRSSRTCITFGTTG